MTSDLDRQTNTHICVTEEQLTLESFKLIDEASLKELGFKMGQRLLLLNWLRQQSAQHCSPVPGCSSTAQDELLPPASTAVASLPVTSSHVLC